MLISWTLPTLLFGCFDSPRAGTGLPLQTPKRKAPCIDLTWAFPSPFHLEGYIICFFPNFHTFCSRSPALGVGHWWPPELLPAGVPEAQRKSQKHHFSSICWVQDMCREKKEMVNTGVLPFREWDCRIPPALKVPMPWCLRADTADLTAPQPSLLCRKQGRRLFRGVCFHFHQHTDLLEKY